MSDFKKNNYQVVRQILSPQLLSHLKTEFELTRDIYCFGKSKYHFGDISVPKSFSLYSPIFFESLLLNMRETISDIVEKELYPCYSYGRIYYNGSLLKKHLDRPSCEYSSTICIHQEVPWSFYVEDCEGNPVAIDLNPGDMCVYSGCKIKHWRNKYAGDNHIQCFLHYVDSNGKHKDFKLDKRSMIGYNSETHPKFTNIYSYN